MSNFWDQVEQYAENAPVAGYGPQVNYGLHEIKPFAVQFHGKGQAPTKTPLEGPLPEGASLELQYTIKISELNPELEFDYQRNITVQKSRKDKNGVVVQPTDWEEIVLPSFIKVFGKDWAKKVGQPFYACSEHVDSVVKGTRKNKETGENEPYNWGCPSLLEVYPDKAACVAARDKRYAKRDAQTGETVASTGSIPENVVAQVKGLIASVGEKKAEEMLAMKPFGDYAVDALMTAAKK